MPDQRHESYVLGAYMCAEGPNDLPETLSWSNEDDGLGSQGLGCMRRCRRQVFAENGNGIGGRGGNK
jgi:hypothetical protein